MTEDSIKIRALEERIQQLEDHIARLQAEVDRLIELSGRNFYPEY